MRKLISSALTLCVLTLLGCGGSTAATGGVETAATTGVVTLNGAPLADATVAFSPQDGQPTAFGTTDATGKYTLTTYNFGDGAAAGNFKAVISKSVSGGAGGDSSSDGHSEDGSGGGAGDSHAAAQAGGAGQQNLVPEKYSRSADTPLSATVKLGVDNVFDFDLE